TRDPDLGKVVLYQLSYFRVGQRRFVVCVAKLGIFFELTSDFRQNFSKNFTEKAQIPNFQPIILLQILVDTD
ncbi:MAG: hypothetical protein ACI391_05715, partial [Muribaculaceae bacterium]